MHLLKNLHLVGHGGAEREHLYSSKYSLVSWKPILAGFLVALVAYVTLGALGAIFGGITAANVDTAGGAKGLAAGAAIWVIVSVMLSLLAGSYFAARTSTFITSRIGAAQGLIIAALFFVSMVYGTAQLAIDASSGVGRVVSTIGMGGADLAGQPAVQNTIEKSLNGVPLKSDPTVVVQGLAVRLLQGNVDGARTYLAFQTGLPESEVNARLQQLEAELKATVKTVTEKTGKAVAAASGVFFLLLIGGLVSSIVGGAVGSRVNFKQPLTDEAALDTNLSHSAI